MQEREIPGKARIDGAIEWVYQSVGQDQNATIRTVPKVGMFYIFPAPSASCLSISRARGEAVDFN